MIHPARDMSFENLYRCLQAARDVGLVYEQIGEAGLRLYCYSDETVYERKWDEATLMARGLILDVEKGEVVATPFPKFFNVGEYRDIDHGEVSPGLFKSSFSMSIPDLPFETFEKLDGSLIIIFYHNGEWKCATKGSFKSDQAKWAQEWMGLSSIPHLDKGTTYLAEAIYPENRIVVDYKGEIGLHLLAAYDVDGHEVNYQELNELGWRMGWKVVTRYSYNSISELLAKAKILSVNEEGWVLRFSDGTRLKIKGDEYCRVHRMIANLTPLAIWRSMKEEEDLEITRRSLPEEFLGDFDKIVNLLTRQLDSLLLETKIAADEVAELSDKEVGLMQDKFATHIRRFIFPFRKGTLLTGRGRNGLFETIRPNRNVLEGYRASSSVTRVQGEEG